MKKAFLALCVSVLGLVGANALAGDLEWSGVYRAEGYSLDTMNLDSSTAKRKEYGLHTLILRPKIVAADGLYLNAQLNVFNADDYNQMGAYFGNGLGVGTPTSSQDSNTLQENQASEQLRLTHFYLTHVQEHGSLIVGRAPQHFGLGMTHNAGRGMFDHFADTRDMVGYKIVMGNFYFFPSYAKMDEGTISGYDDVNEWNYVLQYENPESDVAMGVFYQSRTGSAGGNDTPDLSQTNGGLPIGAYETKTFNVFYKKETTNWTSGFEVAQQSGDTGVPNGALEEIKYGGFGGALEFDWHPEGKSTSLGLRLGYATGDDLTTDDEYEGFIFDRNYDVAMLMFNHGLGQADLLQTKALGRTSSTVNDEPDVEAISNVSYLSVVYKKKWSDKWALVGVFTTGWLDSDKVFVDAGALNGTIDAGEVSTADTDLGYELDVTLEYSISDKIKWLNQFGYLMPGKAWEVGGTFDSDDAIGFVTKAAVSF